MNDLTKRAWQRKTSVFDWLAIVGAAATIGVLTIYSIFMVGEALR